jgi:hypothetical protein
VLRALLLPLLLAAQPVLDGVPAGLLDDRVHVAPGAPAVDEEVLREAVRRAGTSVFVAVLPPGDEPPGALAVALGERVRVDGTYVVLAGDRVDAASHVLPRGTASAAAAAAGAAGWTDATSLLLDVLRRLDRQAVVSGVGDVRDPQGPSPLLLAVPVLGGAALLLQRVQRRHRESERRALHDADAQRRLRSAVSSLEEEVASIGAVVGRHPAAAAEHVAASRRWRAAAAALAHDAVDPARLERVVAEGRFAAARARARVEGRPPPGPPEHLRRAGADGAPAVTLDARGVPVYEGGGSFQEGAWFGGTDGLLTGTAVVLLEGDQEPLDWRAVER